MSGAMHETEESAAAEGDIYKCKYGETRKLTAKNWHQWSRDMEFFLQAEDALEIVLDLEAEPEEGSENLALYRRRLGKAAAMINAACHSTVKGFIKGKRYSTEMWTALTEKLDQVNTRSGRLMIKREFNTLRPKHSMTEYVIQLLECRTELQNSEQEFSDEEFITHLLTTLPPAFDSIVNIITHDKSEEARSVDYVLSIVLEADRSMESRKREVGASTNTSNTLTPSNALIATKFKRSGISNGIQSRQQRFRKAGRKKASQFSSRFSSTNGRNIICFYCTKRGHRIDQCNLKKSAERIRQSFHKDRHSSGIEHSTEGEEAAIATVVQALISFTHSNLNHSAWVLDSGASDHFANQKSAFIPGTLKRLAIPTEIRLGSSARVPTHFKGRIAIAVQNFTVEIEALFAPQLRFSLLSVNKLAESCLITFSQDGCTITRSDDSALSMHLRERNGLYSFHLLRPTASRRQNGLYYEANTAIKEIGSNAVGSPKANEILHL